MFIIRERGRVGSPRKGREKSNSMDGLNCIRPWRKGKKKKGKRRERRNVGTKYFCHMGKDDGEEKSGLGKRGKWSIFRVCCMAYERREK